MKRVLPTLLILALFLVSCAKPSAIVSSKANENSNKDYLLPEDVNYEMMSASYWSDDDTVLLNEKEISKLNQKNSPYVTYTDKEGKEHTVKWDDIKDTVSGDTVKGLISVNDLPSGEYYDKDGNTVSKNFVKRFEDSRNISAIANEVKPKYAVCVKRTVAMCSPMDEPFYEKPNDIYYDCNVSAEVLPNDGVIVLHSSADGEWLFVFADFYTGWIPNDTVAFCTDRENWEKSQSPEKFLVVTGETVSLDSVITALDTFCETAYMGMKIKLSDNATEFLNGRATYGAYCVELPARDKDGMLYYVNATVAISQDVSVGYLPLSSKNILEQSFKFLGHTYGWGGTYGRNDCSGMTRQIYHCFGINLPRNSGDIMSVNGFKEKEFTEDATKDERISAFKKAKPGSILCFRGHIMIYLGMDNGLPYCISSCGSYAPNSAEGKEDVKTSDINCVCINPLNVVRANGKTWLDNISKIIYPE